MAKSTNQKLKILYLMRLLMENTDEEHVMSMSDIIAALEEKGIDAERKSVYDDIEKLKIFGLDILNRRSEPSGYYIASRDFELPEIKLLVDAVQASKFITEKKSRELIKKIEGLAGRYEARTVQNQVVVADRIKTMNESIYYNVDKIHSAISSNSKIRYKYCEWTTDKKLEPKKNGSYYIASPWILMWEDENYYLIAYDSASKEMRHYRVDKMLSIDIIGDKRDGAEQYNSFDIAAFSRKTFGMFAGSETEIELCFDNGLIGVVIDRFGKEVHIIKKKANTFNIKVKVNISTQFYGWLTALGKGARFVSPPSEAEKYVEYINNIREVYSPLS